MNKGNLGFSSVPLRGGVLTGRSIFAVFMAAMFLTSGFFVFNVQAVVSNINLIFPDGDELWRGVNDITWTAVGNPGDTVSILISDNNFITSATLVAGVPFDGSFAWDTTGMLNGSNYKIRVQAPSGDFDTSLNNFTVDNTPPSTSVNFSVSPDATTGWYNTATDKPTITLTCTDNLSGCHSVHWSFNGVSFNEVLGDTATILPAQIPEGELTLHFFSRDNAVDKNSVRNQETTKTSQFKVDTIAPGVVSYTLNGSAANAFFNPGLVDIFITATEPVDWTSAKIVKVDDSTVFKTKQPGNDGLATTSFTWDGSLSSGGPGLVNGEYKISVHIKDVVGNDVDNLELIPFHIFVDTQFPTISSFNEPIADTVYKTGSSIPITFTPSDPLPGTPLTCGYKVGAGNFVPLPGPCTSGSVFNGSINEADLTDGRNNIFAIVKDSAGNTTESSSVSIVFDNNNELTVGATGKDFTTIQEAIDKATSGHAIQVAAGTYTEQLTINKNLTLTGANQATAIVQAPGAMVQDAVGQRSIVTVENAATVNMSGFTVQGPSTQTNFLGVFVKGGATLNLSNSTVKDIRQNPVNGAIVGGTGILVGAGGAGSYAQDSLGVTAPQVGQATLTNVALQSYQVNGVVVDGANNTATITGSTFTGFGLPPPVGVPDYNGINIGPAAVATITNSTFTNHQSPGGFATGINMSSTTGAGVIVSNNTLSANDRGIVGGGGTNTNRQFISNNTLTNHATGFGSGVSLEGGFFQVTNNIITGGDKGVGVFWGDVESEVSDAIITGNVISGAAQGIRVRDGADDGLQTIATINFNSITGSTIAGVNNATNHADPAEAVINATNNWWGTINGPAHASNTFNVGSQGNAVSDNVDFVPWLNAAPPGGVSFAPVEIINPGEQFSSIRAAVEAAETGDTINVVAGTFTESGIVAETDDISIVGAGAGTTFVVASESCPSEFPSAVFHLHDDNITLSGFTVDANNECEHGVHIGDFSEIQVAGVEVSDNEVYGATYGITLSWGSSYDSESPNVVSDNDIHNNDTGMLVDSAHWNLIEDNLIHENNSEGILIGNCIQDFGGCPGGAPSNNVITGNTIEDNGEDDTGIVIDGSGIGLGNSANFNSITGNGFGVDNDTGTIFKAEKNWWGSVRGPTHASNPLPALATSGDSVSSNVNFSPWCTEVPSGAPLDCALGSNDQLNAFVIDADDKDLVKADIQVHMFVNNPLTVTAVDAAGITLINFNGSVQLLADGGAGFAPGPSQFNSGDWDFGIASSTVTNDKIGLVNIDAQGQGASAGKSGSIQVEFVHPTGIVVTSIENKSDSSQADGTFANGFHYLYKISVFDIGLTDLSVKFEDWTQSGGTGAILILDGSAPLGSNARMLIDESGGTGGVVGGFTESIILDGSGSLKSYRLGNEYSQQQTSPAGVPSASDISGIDLSADPGRQVEFHVFFRIPSGTPAGFYTTAFGIQAE